MIGTIASLGGLCISIWLIFITQDARDAAREARALARKRNLVEELESALQMIQQVGNFVQQEQWFAVRLRADEISSTCRIALTRWPDHLSVENKDNVVSAIGLVGSIAKAASEHNNDNGITLSRKRKINDAHVRASDHISSALGEARRSEERDGEEENAN